MRKTKDVEAMSKRNGILFYSNKDPMIGYVAERDENGKIKCDKTFVLFEKYKNLKNYQEENKGKAYIRTKNGKERAHARYHAAEHMVINAYYKLQRVPTIEETKESSRFSKIVAVEK